jgi:hypothetical protein
MSDEATTIFEIPAELPGDDECIEVLAGGHDLRVERIISHRRVCRLAVHRQI